MNKPKIHELAKELNVASKRLIEKLNEIGIYPKSHMTALEPDEVERLYKHIGVVQRDKNEDDSSKSDPDSKAEQAETLARKNAPRIIRTTKVIIHDEPPEEEVKPKQQKPIVRSSNSNDGLMAGFVRGSNDTLITNVRKRTKTKDKSKGHDEENEKPESASILETVMERAANIPKKPMDDIISIKRVIKKSEVEKSEVEKPEADSDNKKIKEQEDMQKVSMLLEKQVEPEIKKEIENKASVKTVDTEDTDLKTADKAMDDNIGETPDKPSIDKEEKAGKKEEVVASDAKEPAQDTKPERRDTAAIPAGTAPESKQVVADTALDDKKGKQTDTRGARPKESAQFQDAAKKRAPAAPGANQAQGQRQRDFRYKDGAPRQRQRPADSQRDDRSGAGKNKNLVIPKATVPPGTVEEKVNLRGERRNFQLVDKLKLEKKEEKRTVSRLPAQKGATFKKKIDTVIGHTAHVKDMMSDDFVIDTFYDDVEEVKQVKKVEKKLKKNKQKEKYIPPVAVLTDITIGETITVKALAEALKKTAAEVIKKLFLMGVVATQNQEIDFETAAIIGDEFGVKVHKEVVVTQEEILFDESEDNPEDLVPRAPVVVVMGHVDHGKTSLLDAIRSAHIAESEAGGITQHIGAYTVNLNGRDITFLDTPGHEAFTAMRARGAQVTDIAILVVAADDGVMPQTKEAISHAKAAGVSIIVAINKIDRPGANPDRVKQELAENGLLVEEWGGDVIAVPVSAKKHQNIDQLLEMVLLTADILDLKANPNKQAKGTVIEARLDKNRGPVATLLVQRGTLRVGDAILSGTTFGHIRSMTNDKGQKITEAGPSIPVEVFGLSEVPEAGDLFYVVTDEKVAKQLVEKRKEEQREKQIGRARISLDDLFNQIQQGNVKDLNLIVKADVQGSVEAICQSMMKLSNDEVKVNIVHSGVGAVIEADVKLAEVSNAIIIGFNVRPTANVAEMAKASGVDMRLYRVIYDAIEDMEKAMKGMLAPTFKEVVDGHAEVRQIFKSSNIGTIGGCYVTDGKILRNSEVRVVRNGIVVYEGKLASLKRFKDDVREVQSGYECGILVERFNDIKEGDVIESFHMEEVERT